MLNKLLNKLFGRTTAPTELKEETVEKSSCYRYRGNSQFDVKLRRSVKTLIYESTHWDGYKREAAVFQLGELGSVKGLSALLERSNDWVWEVRHAAYIAIKKLFKAGNEQAFIDHLDDIYHLRHCRRQNHMSLIEAIEEYLVTNSASLVIENIHHHNQIIARYCYGVASSYRLLAQEELLSIGLRHQDVVIKIQSSRLLQASSPDDLVELALASSFVPIRIQAIRLLVQQYESVDKLMPFLFDRSTSIRNIVIPYLLDHGVNVDNIYVDALVSDDLLRVRCAIWGFGYLKKMANVSSIKPFLHADSPSIRQQALNTLSNLVGLEVKNEMISALSDPSKSVSREALTSLIEHDIQLATATLLKIYRDARVERTKELCLSLNRYRNKWEAYHFLLAVIKEHESFPELDPAVQVAMTRWQRSANKKFTTPTPDQIETLKNFYLSSPELSTYSDIADTLRSIKAIE